MTAPATAGCPHADGVPGPYPFPLGDPFTTPAELVALRAEQPVARVRCATGDEVWVVTRYGDVRQALGERALSRNIMRPGAARLIPGVPTGQVSSPFVDPPAHTRWRRLVSRAFTPRHVELMRPRVQRVADDLVDALLAGPQPADLVASFGYPMSMRVLCALLGISDAEYAGFRDLADLALTVRAGPAEEVARARAGLGEFAAHLVAGKRAAPADDLLSQLVGVVDADDGRLDETELVATVLAMLVGGYESAVHQLGKGLLALLRWPAQRALLVAEPERIGAAVEEVLRFASTDSGFGSPRFAVADVEIGGVTVPAGSTVLLLRQSGDRDPLAWPDGDVFDITRDAARHTAFGHGAHRCLGAALARAELEIGLGTLLRRLPGLWPAADPATLPWDFRITAAGPAALPVQW